MPDSESPRVIPVPVTSDIQTPPQPPGVGLPPPARLDSVSAPQLPAVASVPHETNAPARGDVSLPPTVTLPPVAGAAVPPGRTEAPVDVPLPLSSAPSGSVEPTQAPVTLDVSVTPLLETQAPVTATEAPVSTAVPVSNSAMATAAPNDATLPPVTAVVKITAPTADMSLVRATETPVSVTPVAAPPSAASSAPVDTETLAPVSLTPVVTPVVEMPAPAQPTGVPASDANATPVSASPVAPVETSALLTTDSPPSAATPAPSSSGASVSSRTPASVTGATPQSAVRLPQTAPAVPSVLDALVAPVTTAPPASATPPPVAGTPALVSVATPPPVLVALPTLPVSVETTAPVVGAALPTSGVTPAPVSATTTLVPEYVHIPQVPVDLPSVTTSAPVVPTTELAQTPPPVQAVAAVLPTTFDLVTPLAVAPPESAPAVAVVPSLGNVPVAIATSLPAGLVPYRNEYGSNDSDSASSDHRDSADRGWSQPGRGSSSRGEGNGREGGGSGANGAVPVRVSETLLPTTVSPVVNDLLSSLAPELPQESIAPSQDTVSLSTHRPRGGVELRVTLDPQVPVLEPVLATLPPLVAVDVAVTVPPLGPTATTYVPSDNGVSDALPQSTSGPSAASLPSLVSVSLAPVLPIDGASIATGLPGVSAAVGSTTASPAADRPGLGLGVNPPVAADATTASRPTDAPAVGLAVNLPIDGVAASVGLPGVSVTAGTTASASSPPTDASTVSTLLPALLPSASLNLPGVAVVAGPNTIGVSTAPGLPSVSLQPQPGNNGGIVPPVIDVSLPSVPPSANGNIGQPAALPQVISVPSTPATGVAVASTDKPSDASTSLQPASAAAAAANANAQSNAAPANPQATAEARAPSKTEETKALPAIARNDSLVVVDSLVFDTASKTPLITNDKQLRLNEASELSSSLEPTKALDAALTPASATDEPQKYVRGQTSIQSAKSELAEDSKTSDGKASEKDKPLVIGGKRRGATADTSVTASRAQVYESIRYSASLAAGLSLALLVGFHFSYLDPRLTWSNARWSPNTWEFVLYVQYLQQATSLSALTLLKTPYFLWEFTDTFSWTNFLIQTHTDDDDSHGQRRLRTIVLDGLVGYSDRIGHDETRIMYQCVYAFVLLLMALCGAFTMVKVIGKLTQRDMPPLARNQITANESVALRILGLGVLLWYFSLFPLSLTSSFEIAMEVQANLIEFWPMSLSVCALLGTCSLGLALAARAVLSRSEKQLRRFHTAAIWSALYADYTHATRMFFMLGASVQVVSGVSIGVFGSSSTLLVLLVAVQLLYVLSMATLAPFAHSVVRTATYVVSATKVLNFVLAFAFLQSSELSAGARERVANAYLGINALVLFVWFLRHLVLFCSCVAAYSAREQGPLTPLSIVGRGDVHNRPGASVTGVFDYDDHDDHDALARKIAAEAALTSRQGYTTSLSPCPTVVQAPVTATDWQHAQSWHRSGAV